MALSQVKSGFPSDSRRRRPSGCEVVKSEVAMGSDLLPEFIAQGAALSKLLEELLQHAHDDRIHADALGLGPLPQFDPRLVADMKQHGVRQAKSGFSSLNDRYFLRIGM